MGSKKVLLLSAALAALVAPGQVHAQAASPSAASPPLRIGLASDLTGPYAALGGKGALLGAQMAVEDFGGTVLGRKIELLQNDTQNKPDVGVNFVREWFERQNVRAVLDGSASSVGLAIQTLAKQSGRMFLSSGSFTSELVGASCTPSTIQFIPNTRGLAVAGLQQAIADGVDTWYFLTPDYAFGHALQRDATGLIQAAGGKVLGAALHPLAQSDLSAYLVRARSSGAKALAIASAGGDLVNAVKQIREFGLAGGPMRIYGLLVNFSDLEALGDEAQGLRFVTSTYWARDDKTRAWSQRFMARHGGRQPTMVHSMSYSAALHYLKSVQAAGTDDTEAVLAKMRATPVDDVWIENASIRADGRVMNDLYTARVRKPGEVADKRDTVALEARVPAERLYAGESACPLMRSAN